MSQDNLPPGVVAKMLGVDPKTVSRWAKVGKINGFRTPGGHLRIPAAEVERIRDTSPVRKAG